MAIELATAYVSVVASTGGLKDSIKDVLGETSATSQKAGKGIGDKMMDGIGGALKGGLLAAGAVAVAGIGTALVKGFQRLDSLDQATAKLTGLGHSAESVSRIMDNALASVQGTAFGMDEAAGAAGILVGAGVQQGETLERALKLTADAATIAGTDMGSMGAIFGKVAAKGKLDGDVMAQLLERQIGILPQLADYYGVTTEEASKMVSEGKVNFEDFANVMESTLGGAALASGDTFSGSMDNMMASLGRVGANLLSGFFPEMKNGVSGLTEFFRGFEVVAADMGRELGNFVTDVGPGVAETFRIIGEVISNTVSFVKDNLTWIGPLVVAIGAATAAWLAWNLSIGAWNKIVVIGKGIQTAFNAVMAANPIMLVVMAVAALVAGLIWFFTQTELGQQIWANFTKFISEAWENTVQFLTEAFANIGQFIADTLTNISTVWNTVWANIGKFISDVWNNIVNWVKGAMDNVSNFISGALGAIRSAWENVWNGIGGFLRGVWNNILGWIEGGVNGAIDLINGMIGGISDVAAIIGIEIGTIPHVRIPRLAEGGVVSRRPGGILANIGEGRYDEAVVPLSPDVLSKLGGGNGGTVNIYPTFQQADSRLQMRQWGREAERALAAI